MALFPRIQSPCPYKDDLAEIVQDGFCRMCSREVHDITAMSDDERLDLIGDCQDEICVSYRLPTRTVLAAAAMGVGFGMSGAAMAADQGTATQDAAAASAADYDPAQYLEIIVGGMKQPKRTVWVDSRKASKLATLPVVYEDEPAADTKGKPAAPASKVNSAS